MLRAGREPAEDTKRRLIAACERVGLEVSKAQMCLTDGRTERLIYVCASVPGWPHELSMVTLQTFVTTGGDTLPIEIYCSAIDASDDPVGKLPTVPLMNGRKELSLDELVDELCETLAERSQVLRALARGDEPPFFFDQTVWACPDPLT